MKRILSLAGITLVLCSAAAHAQQPPQASDRDAYQKAVRIADPIEQIKALEQFVKDYPTSTMLRGAYQALFNALLRTQQKALEYADKAIEAAPEAERPGVYNSIAWPLAEQGIQLERARDYIQKGVDLAREKKVNPRMLAMYLDTQALVQYKLGEYAAAEKTQREAYGYLPQGPEAQMQNMEYRTRLGTILVRTGKQAEAAALLAPSVLLTGSKDAAKAFDEALGGDAAARKTELLKKAAEQYVASASRKDTAERNVAVGYARSGVLAAEALAIARKGVDGLTPKSAFDAYIGAYRTLGLVNAHLKNHAEAVEHLGKIAPLAQPYDTDVFLRLGESLEALGRNDEALRVYLAEAALVSIPPVTAALNALYKKVHGSDAGLKEELAKLTEEMTRFKPSGPEKTSVSGRGVLAELFTGSECPPCVAADVGFDHVLAAYDRKAAIVLEYHLHIPGPDPMTNDDTETRAKYYGVGGTPSVFIGGTESAGGGGGKAMAKNRFAVYSYLLDRKLRDEAAAAIDLQGSFQGSGLAVRAAATTAAKGDLKLRIALVEDAMHYPGGNGLAEHRYVVRRMIGTPAGIALTDGKAAHSETIDLTAVANELKNYLEKWEKSPPGRFASMKNFAWKEKKHEMNLANLALVAFVQDDATKDVLQAAFLKLPAAPRGSTSGQ